MPPISDPNGPIVWPTRPPDGETMALITSKLAGHVTSTRWLPAGLWPELDEIREEHLRVRTRIAADVTAWKRLHGKHVAEDAAYEAGLEQAHRAGVEPPEDHRTPHDQRAAAREGIERSLWAGARVMVEVVERARALMVAREDAWLHDLSRSSAQAQEKLRDLQRQLDEAKVEAWRGVQLGRWLKRETEGGPFSQQPAPDGREPMPPQFEPSGHHDAFRRAYHERELVQPLTPFDDPLGNGILDPYAKERASDSIEPLDPEDRYVDRGAAA